MPEVDATIRYADIPRFRHYKVGTDGSVWSCRLTGHKDRKRRVSDQWHQLKASPNHGNGYLCVGLMRGRLAPRRVTAHSLVLSVFVGPRPPGMQACHLDGNKTNNCLGNLAWGTPKRNSADRVQHGKQACRLHRSQVPAIRALFSQGLSCAQIAQQFGVSEGTIAALIQGRTWSHVPGAVDRVNRPKPTRGKFKKGLIPASAKLTPEDVLEIRRLHASGVRNRDLRLRFGVGKSSIRRAIRGQTWKTITPPVDPTP